MRNTPKFLTVSVMLSAGSLAQSLLATEWHAIVGGESRDLGSQALAFLPNEVWVHAGDSVRWTLGSTEIHTVTFLTTGQNRPPLFGAFGVQVGCPGTTTTPDGTDFDETKCVNSGVLGQFDTLVGPKTYSVHFPVAGNFKLECLVHTDMTGTVHVLNATEPLPHNQAFYDAQARIDGVVLVTEASRLAGRGNFEGSGVTAGIGEIVTTTGAGSQTASLNRFLRSTVVVRVGDTVEWTNLDPSTPHTVIFGTEPADPRPPSQPPTVTNDPDGARHAVLTSTTASASSGLLVLGFQDRPNLAQAPLSVTRFRVTFNAPGTFNYICALHDNLGMKGTVIVH
jgi:plastocyanin